MPRDVPPPTTTTLRRPSKIADERLKPGDKIPSLTELQAEYGVSDTVILEARKVLVAEGLLVARSRSHRLLGPGDAGQAES
ncbi:GntR family transcriptional regulator [Streptomyces sp. A1547]|nr:GntR family transcriptional regulator [Streptomyces sp. A1547]